MENTRPHRPAPARPPRERARPAGTADPGTPDPGTAGDAHVAGPPPAQAPAAEPVPDTSPDPAPSRGPAKDEIATGFPAPPAQGRRVPKGDAAAGGAPAGDAPAKDARIPGASTPTPSTPGASASGRLLESADAERFRRRLREVQAGFVDDPGEAVRDADALASDAAEALGRALASHRRRLAEALDGGEGGPDTERLRLALRGYRDLLDRVLAT